MIWSIWIIDLKNVELNSILNSLNFHDLNFSIIQIELLNKQKQYEIEKTEFKEMEIWQIWLPFLIIIKNAEWVSMPFLNF